MRIKEKLILRRIGDEYVIIVPDKDSVDMTDVYTLNETSAQIWKQFQDKDFTVEDVVEYLMQHYEVDQERAKADIQIFADKLKAEDLVMDC